MAYLVKARVGRSQGAVIFWGLVSAFFASAFCYYYLENRSNEEKNRQLVDQVMTLQGATDSLTSERQKIEAAASDQERQMNEREQFLQEKETNLAQEEAQIEAAGTPGAAPQAAQAAQAAGVKKFEDAVRKAAGKVPDADVVVRGGRPVLRVPASYFFDPAGSQLKPDGKALLSLVAQAATGTAARFELRVETFTDRAGEPPAPPANPATPTLQKSAPVDAWTLTGTRAAALAHYLRDSSAVPFQNVIAVGRADFSPLDSGTKPGSARNRRVEITIAPVPAPFRPPEPAKAPRAKPVSAAPAAAANDATGAP